MTQISINYGRTLYELSVPKESVIKAENILKRTPQLMQVLESPIVPLEKKEKVISRIFPKELESFLCVVCKYHHAGLLLEMFQAYQECYNEQNKILTAALYYVDMPSHEQAEGMKTFLKNKFHTEDVALELKEDKSLVGGFILRAKDQEFDYSLKGRINALQQKLIWR